MGSDTVLSCKTKIVNSHVAFYPRYFCKMYFYGKVVYRMGRSIIITTGGGTDVEDGNPNVTANKVLAGYTIYAMRDEPIIGSIPNQLSADPNIITLNPGESYVVPEGAYDGNRVVKTTSLSSNTSATAEPSQILKDRTGWRGGIKQTGTIVDRGTQTSSLSANGTYTIPQGWHNGSGKVTQSLSTQAATNITPSTVQKTVITASKWSIGNQIVTGDSNLIAGNIKRNVTIFGVSGSWGIDRSAGVKVFWTGSSSGIANGFSIVKRGLITSGTMNMNNWWRFDHKSNISWGLVLGDGSYIFFRFDTRIYGYANIWASHRGWHRCYPNDLDHFWMNIKYRPCGADSDISLGDSRRWKRDWGEVDDNSDMRWSLDNTFFQLEALPSSNPMTNGNWGGILFCPYVESGWSVYSKYEIFINQVWLYPR